MEENIKQKLPAHVFTLFLNYINYINKQFSLFSWLVLVETKL